jgi:cell wall-associated NlpC family hydrolase
VNLTEEQANKISVEASLLPAKFDFEVYKATKDFEIKLAAGQVSVARLGLDALKAANDNIDSTRKGFIDSAESNRKAAASLELQAMDETDETIKADLLKQSAQRKADAAEAIKAADALKGQSSKVYEELSKRGDAPSGAFSQLGAKYKDGGFTYSQANRGSNSSVDCSSLVCRSYSDMGIKVDMNTAAGLWESFERLPEPRVGVTVFFKDGKPSAGRAGRSAHHTGMIVGKTADGGWIMRHASQANNKVIDVRLDEYLRQTGGRMSLLGYGQPKNMSGAFAVSKQADHLPALAAEFGLPRDQVKLWETINKKESGWRSFKPTDAGESAQVGDILFVEDPDTEIRALKIDSIDYEKGTVSLRAGKKTFSKKFADLPPAMYFRPPGNK